MAGREEPGVLRNDCCAHTGRFSPCLRIADMLRAAIADATQARRELGITREKLGSLQRGLQAAEESVRKTELDTGISSFLKKRPLI